MWKGVKGRKAIVAFFCREIPKRRAGQGTDLFSELCRASKEDGSPLTDQEVADHMSFLMMAATISTKARLTPFACGPSSIPRKEVAAKSSVSCLMAG